MSRSARLVALLGLAGALGAIAPGAALAQGAPPKASATALPAGHPAVGGDGLPSGHPAVGGDGLPSGHPAVGGDGLPAGHPAVGGDGVPPGHPAMPDEGGDGDDDDPMAGQPNPHAGGDAHGGGDPRFFQAPPDGTQEDPSLPVGTIVVSLRDAKDQPVPRGPIALSELFNTVAKGESPERVTQRDVGEDGITRFDGLTIGSSTTYKVSSQRGAGHYDVPRFSLNDKAGKRVVLHVYDASANIEELPAGSQGMVYVSLREDAIQIEQLLSVFNLGPVSWTPEVVMSLPAGFKAFNKQEGGDARVEEVAGKGAALRGTFGPGRHDIDFRYQIPLDEEEKQSFKIELPPHTAQVRVIAEAARTMSLDVKGFPVAQKTNREGKRLLVTEKQMSRADGGVSELQITLYGLPTPGPGRWIAVLLALIAIGVGGAYYLQRMDPGTIDDDARSDLVEAREALLKEIVALERAHAAGEIGPKTYARLRAAMLDSLARIVAMLEGARDAKAEARKRRRGGKMETVL
jgi:hypothetical protein